MRLKRNYFNALRRFSDWLFSRFKSLTVHTETIMLDSVWEEIQRRIKGSKIKTWYVMTPTNADYFKSEFNVKIPKQKLSEIMSERYKWMIKKGQRLELHLHLSLVMANLSYKEQENMFKEALNWMEKEIGIKPKEIVLGWWACNKDTLKLCEKYRLKIIRERDYDFIHDYDFIL